MGTYKSALTIYWTYAYIGFAVPSKHIDPFFDSMPRPPMQLLQCPFISATPSSGYLRIDPDRPMLTSYRLLEPHDIANSWFCSQRVYFLASQRKSRLAWQTKSHPLAILQKLLVKLSMREQAVELLTSARRLKQLNIERHANGKRPIGIQPCRAAAP